MRTRTILVVDQLALVLRPAKISAAGILDVEEVDLLLRALADIGNRDTLSVERETPGIAEAVGKDLVPAGLADERIVLRNAIGASPSLRGSMRRILPSKLPRSRAFSPSVAPPSPTEM
jgi:hypothetical protein